MARIPMTQIQPAVMSWRSKRRRHTVEHTVEKHVATPPPAPKLPDLNPLEQRLAYLEKGHQTLASTLAEAIDAVAYDAMVEVLQEVRVICASGNDPTYTALMERITSKTGLSLQQVHADIQTRRVAAVDGHVNRYIEFLKSQP